MSSILKRLLSLCCLLSLLACGSEQNRLVGHWQGVSLTENGDSVLIDPAMVQFDFTDQGIYQFQSTLSYQEAGYYRNENPWLYTRDTTGVNPEEKAVRFSIIANDSLHINMIEQEKERLLILLRKD